MFTVTSYNKFNNEIAKTEHKTLSNAEFTASWISCFKSVWYAIITDEEFNRYGFYENGKKTGEQPVFILVIQPNATLLCSINICVNESLTDTDTEKSCSKKILKENISSLFRITGYIYGKAFTMTARTCTVFLMFIFLSAIRTSKDERKTTQRSSIL